MSTELVKQCHNAFEFIEKLYYEVSYLIRDIECSLSKEPEKFIICKPSGYGVINYKSNGLDPGMVPYWMTKTATVAFIPSSPETKEGGQTVTRISDSLRMLIVHIELNDEELEAPRVLAGSIWGIKSKKANFKKFEQLLWEFAYYYDRIFAHPADVNYEDSNCTIKGKFIEQPLFSLTDSQTVANKLIAPMLKIYRG